jgi:predicted RNA binding protein YcfA (HicA-like mRNA interferase family)
MLERLGYVRARRKGSHVSLTKMTPAGAHHVTVPDHRVLAKGTLNDILASVSVQNAITKNELIARL